MKFCKSFVKIIFSNVLRIKSYVFPNILGTYQLCARQWLNPDISKWRAYARPIFSLKYSWIFKLEVVCEKKTVSHKALKQKACQIKNICFFFVYFRRFSKTQNAIDTLTIKSKFTCKIFPVSSSFQIYSYITEKVHKTCQKYVLREALHWYRCDPYVNEKESQVWRNSMGLVDLITNYGGLHIVLWLFHSIGNCIF